MSTKAETMTYILDQLTGLPDVSARKMFGEYALYCNGKVVALICNDQLFVKITEPGKAFLGNSYEEGEAYPGAKPSMRISEELLEDQQWLCELIQRTAVALPLPTPKRK